MLKVTTWAVTGPLVFVLASAGCTGGSGAAKAPAVPDVQVAQVQQRDVPIYGEWLGTLDGMVNPDIKAQITGYLERQEDGEGSLVEKGALLFPLYPPPLPPAPSPP